MVATLSSILPSHHLEPFSIPTPARSIVKGYSRGFGDGDRIDHHHRPVLVLIHGYPETNFMWRHVIRLLPNDIPLFIPDIPGYGESSPSEIGHDKSTIGLTILNALQKLLDDTETATAARDGQKAPWPIILCGHDRGARICHRLSVDAQRYADRFTILGTVLMDIVPTLVQWEGMARPAEAAGFFHWPFLANVDLATEMILAMGGEAFIRRMFDRWKGTLTTQGLDHLTQDGALEVYANFFRQESVIRASNLDYEAGATVDVEQQKEDQAAGRKLALPTLVLHSAGIGRRYDLSRTWADWVSHIDDLVIQQVGGGAGHFFAEENPEETVQKLLAWFGTIGVFRE